MPMWILLAALLHGRYKFERKLFDYRKAKVTLVWEVNPKFRFIRVHFLDRPPERLEETDTLTGTPVLPEFSVLVKELLPPPDISE